MIKENKFDATSVDACEISKPAKTITPIVFARFFCALLIFCEREFPAKYKTQEPWEIIVECTLYI